MVYKINVDIVFPIWYMKEDISLICKITDLMALVICQFLLPVESLFWSVEHERQANFSHLSIQIYMPMCKLKRRDMTNIAAWFMNSYIYIYIYIYIYEVINHDIYIYVNMIFRKGTLFTKNTILLSQLWR